MGQLASSQRIGTGRLLAGHPAKQDVVPHGERGRPFYVGPLITMRHRHHAIAQVDGQLAVVNGLDYADCPNPPHHFERAVTLVNDDHVARADHDAVALDRGGIARLMGSGITNESNQAPNVVGVYDASQRQTLAAH